MDEDEVLAVEERRAYTRRAEDHDVRIRRLEASMAAMDKTVAITEIRVQGLASTIESRFKAFDRGVELILEKQTAAEVRSETEQAAWDNRVVVLEKLKERAEGGMWVVRLLGVSGLVGGSIAIFKLIKGL